MFFGGTNINLKVGKSHSIMLDMASKKLDAILEDTEEPDLFEDEKALLKLQEYNVWDIHESENLERYMTVEFEKYIIRATELLGVDVSNYSVYKFMCMNEMLQERNAKQKNG